MAAIVAKLNSNCNIEKRPTVVKTSCINAIIASILYKAKPDEVNFILIDPKKVELSSYNALKDYHLITTPKLDEDVITKTENSTGVLESAITEMERRFQIFSDCLLYTSDAADE